MGMDKSNENSDYTIQNNQEQPDIRILAMMKIKAQVIKARQYKEQKIKEANQVEHDKKPAAIVQKTTMRITEYLELKWISRIIKIILFFMIGIAITINFQTSYFAVVDFFALFGFSILSYVSFNKEKLISGGCFGFCAFLFFIGMSATGYPHSSWVIIDAIACTTLIICTVYDIAIRSN